MVIISPIPWRFMMAQKLERVDTAPLIVAILKKMDIRQIIDGIWK
jgi:hypothetical protein